MYRGTKYTRVAFNLSIFVWALIRTHDAYGLVSLTLVSMATTLLAFVCLTGMTIRASSTKIKMGDCVETVFNIHV